MENSKKHPTLGVWCAPPKYFSEFYKLFLGFYKSHFSGTTLVLVEKCLLLVYRLFKHSKNLTFIRVRRHKTLNDAIYIWVIRTRTGKKLDKCHFFFKSQRLLRTEKSKNSYTFKSYYLILASRVLKI